jgi:hypothetical protein
MLLLFLIYDIFKGEGQWLGNNFYDGRPLPRTSEKPLFGS